jgi:SHS2 domain-containing protein
LAEPDLPALFRSWLRTILFWEETEGFVATEVKLLLLPTPLCGTPDGQAFGLQGEVEGVLDSGPRVREVKGVTLHGLTVEQTKEGWAGRVIFDV